MKIRLNGVDRDVPEGCTVGDLLAELALKPEGVAVALDRRVVPRTEHAFVRLTTGADVEVLRAVGGG